MEKSLQGNSLVKFRERALRRVQDELVRILVELRLRQREHESFAELLRRQVAVRKARQFRVCAWTRVWV